MPTPLNIYLISGDDPLLCQLAHDTLVARANKLGFTQRERIIINSAADWQTLPYQAQSQGLFGDKRCLDVYAQDAKLDKTAQQTLKLLIDQYHPDTFIIMSCAKLTPAQRKTKWFQSLQQQIQVQLVWPIKSAEYPQWLQQQAKQHQVQLNREATQLLAQLTLGNLLAGQQALTKLNLAFPNIAITPQHVAQAMSDSARYTIFDLTDAALQGHTQSALDILQHLRETHQEPVLILWALTKEIRELWMQINTKTGSATPSRHQWAARKALLQTASRRHQASSLASLLQQAHMADCMIKGVLPGETWQALSHITQHLSQGATS